MFEHRTDPLLSTVRFAYRMLRGLVAVLLVVGLSLGAGVLGYHYLVGLDWLDALLNASMILGGMGPVDPITTVAGKWFATLYALFSGLVMIATTGILLAPLLHRVMHSLHFQKEPAEKRKKP